MPGAIIDPMADDPYDEMVPVPRAARFPIELRPPAGFRPDDPATWPSVEGRLEYLGGRLLYMPPCGGVQQVVAVDCVGELWTWSRQHPEFFVGANEAGMLLGGEVRGAEGAVWRREDLGGIPVGYIRVPPILVVEVAGREEGEPELRAKAAWYFVHGVQVAWLVLPGTREVVVLRSEGPEIRLRSGERLPADPRVPGLEPEVRGFFRQLDTPAPTADGGAR